MNTLNFRLRAGLAAIAAIISWAPATYGEPFHGIAMYGEPELPAGFTHLPYANPDAPKGGRIVEGNTGGFDSLNPFVRKGNVPWQLRFVAYESLMGRNRDEAFSLYGLLAQSIETAPDRSWVEFTLREEARFSDGSPVTVEDVIWSYETLGTKGHPRYLGFWKKVASITATGERSIRLTFNEPDRELALIAGLRPILKKAQWDDLDFTQSTLTDIPIGSAPYVVDDFEAGRFVSLKRNPEYWGNDLPLRRGTYNFDEYRIEFYGDGDVLFEAFKAGELSFLREFNAEDWATRYDFPAVTSGEVIQSELPHQKPSGMTGFVMNTRRAGLDDIRVRDAMLHAFNFEFINDTMTGGRQPRITSYFSGSLLSMKEGAATGRTAALLQPFANDLPPEALEGYEMPSSDGTARNRRNLRKAMKLFEEAGFVVVDGQMRKPDGTVFAPEVLLRQNDRQSKAIMDIYRKSLEKLGIFITLSEVDNAQFSEREGNFDFDITSFRRDLSLSPGNEQRLYWGSETADLAGSRNLMGAKHPAIDQLIGTMLTSTSREEFEAATRALDRVLTTQRFVIPIWTYSEGRIAHRREMRVPASLPIYGEGYWLRPRSGGGQRTRPP